MAELEERDWQDDPHCDRVERRLRILVDREADLDDLASSARVYGGRGHMIAADGEIPDEEPAGAWLDEMREDPAPPEVKFLPPPQAPFEVAKALIEDRYSAGELRRWRGAFWKWTGPHWSEVEDAAVRSELYRFTENAIYPSGDTFAPWSPTRHKIADLLDALAAISHLPESVTTPTWIDDASGAPANEIVACANGLLHVTSRELGDHRVDYFNQVSVPFDYQADANQPIRWLKFLDELWPDDPDAIAALQEYIGYVISGRTDLHKILLLIGPTRAGKGVISRVLKTLVGSGNAAGPTLASMGTNFGLSPLIGKPLAIISDARLGRGNAHQIVERLLSVSGEDMLTIDRKYKEPWTGTLPTRFVVISNELPRFGDASGAIANRMILLTLTQTFLGRENPELTRDLLKELPGILVWALNGFDRLTTQGRFTVPTSSADAVLSLQDLASPMSAFVRDRCEIGVEHEVTVEELFAAWQLWCEDNGRDRPGSAQTLGRDLRAVVPSIQTVRPRGDDGRKRRYTGLGLRQTHNAPDRGPVRTTAPVHDGPQSTPMLSQHEDDYLDHLDRSEIDQ